MIYQNIYIQIDYMSNVMAFNSEKYHIFLAENDKRYNLKFNEHFYKYFGNLNNFKNLESLKVDSSIDKTETLNKLLEEFVKKVKILS